MIALASIVSLDQVQCYHTIIIIVLLVSVFNSNAWLDVGMLQDKQLTCLAGPTIKAPGFGQGCQPDVCLARLMFGRAGCPGVYCPRCLWAPNQAYTFNNNNSPIAMSTPTIARLVV